MRQPRMVWMEITREKAALWLSNPWPNRTPGQTTIRNYSRDMQMGVWRHGDAGAMTVTTTSRIVDGRHRLLALLACPEEVSIWSWVKEVSEEEAAASQEVIDTGRPRSLANTLEIIGYSRRTAQHASPFLGTSIYWASSRRITQALPRSLQVRWLEENENTAQAVQFSVEMFQMKDKMVEVSWGVSSTLWDIASFGYGSDTVEEFIPLLQRGYSDTYPMILLLARKLQDQKLKRNSPLTTDTLGYAVARVYGAWVVGDNLSAIYPKRETSLYALPGWDEWMAKRWGDLFDVRATPTSGRAPRGYKGDIKDD